MAVSCCRSIVYEVKSKTKSEAVERRLTSLAGPSSDWLTGRLFPAKKKKKVQTVEELVVMFSFKRNKDVII